MKKTLLTMKSIVTNNFKTLLLFEILYRLFGVFFILPIVSNLFQLSIKLSGRNYITNKALVSYLFSPGTVIIFIFLSVLIAIYVLFELIGLFELYKVSLSDSKIKLLELIKRTLESSFRLLKKHPVLLITRAFIFIFVVEAFQLLGIIQTQDLPVFFEQVTAIKVVYQGLWVFSILMFMLFIESFFVIPALGFKSNFKEARRLLKGSRIKLAVTAFIINISISALIYLLNIFILFIVGTFVFLTKGEVYITSTVLSLFYIFYISLTFLSTLIIIPINFAFVLAKYHQLGGQRLDLTPVSLKSTLRFSNKWVKRGALVFLLVFIGLNIQTFSVLLRLDRSPLELFNRPLVVAHRGASASAPENTMAAFELAVYQNADAVELDVRLSKDGVVVVFHDSNILRTTTSTQSRMIESLTIAEIKNLDAGSKFSPLFASEKVPTLYETLDYLKGKATVFIELKALNEALEDETISVINSLDMADDVVIQSFNQLQLKRVKEKSEGKLTTLLLMPILYGDIDNIFNNDDFDYFGFSVEMVKSKPIYIEKAHEMGKRIYVWTVNSEADIRLMSNYDVDGIMTDYPLKTLEIVFGDYRFSIIEQLLGQFRNK